MRLFKGKAATELGFSTETLRALQSLGEGFALFSRVQVDQYEIDWLTVSFDQGWFGVYEEKRFPGNGH